MKTLSSDVVVIGAGPVGCVTALAFARSGAKVLLLEAHPQTGKRLAGEWLHPPSFTVLERLGVLLTPQSLGYSNGKGFVIFPDDGTQPIQLSYPNGAMGLSCEHGEILSALREAAVAHPDVYFMANARVTSISAQTLTFESGKHCETGTILAERIIGADGRASATRKALGIPNDSKLVSYMAGVLLEDVELPFEGFGHVFLGGPGPAVAYRVAKNKIRICLDVPLH
jgi:squalene monooxygenase